MSTVRLWTTQNMKVLKDIEEKGVYKVNTASILAKYDTCADLFMNVYKWFSKAAGAIVPKPPGVQFPVWAAMDKEFSFGLTEGQVRLELEVDIENVIIFDSGKWDYILNYWYIPENKADELKYEEKLQSLGIKNKSLIYMQNFYPTLKREVENSWGRLFDPSIRISEINQATLWEIRAEWIKDKQTLITN